MKSDFKLALVTAVIGLLAGLFLVAQQAPIPSRQAIALQNTNYYGLVFCDTNTWRVIGPDADRIDYSYLNTAQQILARRLAALAITDPKEYARQVPLSPQQLQARQQAAADFLNPKAYANRIKAGKTPEQLQRDAEALARLREQARRPVPPGLK